VSGHSAFFVVTRIGQESLLVVDAQAPKQLSYIEYVDMGHSRDEAHVMFKQ
jgi:hypothetical protein